VNRCAAVLGAIVVGLGLVAGCATSGADPTTPTVAESQTPQSSPPDTTEIDQWVDGFIDVMEYIPSGHIVVDQEFVTGGSTDTTHIEVDFLGINRHCEGTLLGYTFEAILIGDTAYFLGEEDDWEEVPRRELTVQEPHLNPATIIVTYRTSIIDIEWVGTEDLDGVIADQYVITFDTDGLDVPLGADYAASLMGDTVTADIWLDALRRPVQYRSTTMVRKDMASGRIVLTATYSDYGKDVTIEAPM